MIETHFACPDSWLFRQTVRVLYAPSARRLRKLRNEVDPPVALQGDGWGEGNNGLRALWWAAALSFGLYFAVVGFFMWRAM